MSFRPCSDSLRSRLALATVVCVLTAIPSEACESFDPQSHSSPLGTRKPVLGEEVRLTTGFGMRRDPVTRTTRLHPGTDWAATPGTPVVAAGGGRVSSAETMQGYGPSVLVDHGGGWQTLYAGLGSLGVRQGDCVSGGTILGKVGAIGENGGPALHFEVRINGTPIDPLSAVLAEDEAGAKK